MKFVLPCSEMMNMKSKGLADLYTYLLPREMRRRSVMNSTYCCVHSDESEAAKMRDEMAFIHKIRHEKSG
jgi:hypothetical protein